MPLAPRNPATPDVITEAPVRARTGQLLGTSARLLVSRFSYGVTPALARQVVDKGGVRAWFEWQLSPGQIRDPDLVGLDLWWPGLAHSGLKAMERHLNEVEPA